MSGPRPEQNQLLAALPELARRRLGRDRGRIAVLDRPGLEVRTCECYQVVKKEYDRLLPNLIAV